jgi:hypothetical protein
MLDYVRLCRETPKKETMDSYNGLLGRKTAKIQIDESQYVVHIPN